MLLALLMLLAGPARALDPGVPLAQLQHSVWRGEAGAPAHVLALAQTRDGYLWLGTGSGLFRFDGMRFEAIRAVQGRALPAGSISALQATADGRLLIGYRHGGVGLLGPLGYEHHPEQLPGRASLPAGNAWAFAEDAEGGLWAAFTGGLARLQGGRWQRFALDGAPLPFRTLVLDREGNLWVTAKTGAYVRTRGAADFQRVGADLPAYPALSLAPDGRVWAADFKRARLGALQPDRAGGFELAPESASLPWPAGADRHWFDADGGLWIRSGAGLLRLPDPTGAPARVERFGAAEGLSGEAHCWLQDREGNVWIGTAAGLDRLRVGHVRRIALSAAPGAQDGGVGVAPAAAGGVWASSEFGGLFRVGPAGAPVTALPEVGRRASHLHHDRFGRLWIGTRGELWQLDERGRPRQIPRPDAGDDSPPLTLAPVHAMALDQGGALWASLVVKGTFRRVGERWEAVPPEIGNRIMSMGNDAEGRLWLGYIDRGARRVDGPPLAFGPHNGLDIGPVMAIAARGPRVWLGGQRGLALYDGRQLHRLRFAGLPPFSVVSGLVESAAGDLWVNAADGLSRIAAADWQRALVDPEHPVRAERFDAFDGLAGSASQVRPLPSLVEAADGRLWLALPSGLFMLDPARLARNRLAPPVLIQALIADGRRHEPEAGTPRLAKGRADLRIEYTATSLAIPQRVRFRYMLEGYDADWQEAGARREAVYTQVGPGRYRFRVSAANNDGVWNEAGASLEFEVPPAFWQTPWFLALGLALAGLAGWALYRRRIRQISARLRERLEERLEGRLRERERIARELHDTLLQSITGLTLQVEAAAQQLPPASPVRRNLERLLDQAELAIGEGRDRVSELRSAPPDLPEALARACRQLAALFPGPACRFEIAGRARAVDALVAEELEFVAREAVSNALRHAGGRNVLVQLCFEPEALALRVQDDGQGFEVERGARPGHFGLAGMRERARRIGARLSLHSGAGGTELLLLVPAGVAYPAPGTEAS